MDIESPQKTNSGCIPGGCGTLGCGLLIVIPLLIIGSAWFILFHTPIPFNWFAKLLNKDENIEVGKVSGSLSKGFQIAEIEFSAKPGQVSLLKDVRILYPDLIKGLRKNEFNIKEIGVASARMYVDFNSKDGEGSLQINGGGSDSDKDSEDSTLDSDVSSEGGSLKRFHIGRVDIRNIELLDPKNDFEFQLDECTLDGLEITQKQIQMGQLTIRSSVLDFSLSPIETSNTGELSSKVELKASLQPNEALSVINTINLVGSFDFSVKDYPKGTFNAFDKKLQVELSEGMGQMEFAVKDLTLAEYFDLDVILPAEVNWDGLWLNGEDAPSHVETSKGSFIIGETPFTFAEGKTSSTQQMVVATSSDTNGNYTFFIEEQKDKDQPRIRLQSKSEPEKPSREILAELNFGKSFDQLDATEKQRVSKTLGEDNKSL